MDQAEIDKRFDHHPPNQSRADQHVYVRAVIKETAEALNEALPESREKSLMLTSLEEALMWANACIARNVP